MKAIKCLIRKEWVTPHPEEIIRQRILKHMIDNLGFPSGNIVVEQKLSKIPHLSLKDQKIPNRRVDIICYAKGIHPQFELYPLLLVECKAIPLTTKVIKQVIGYNYFVQAYFVAVANRKECRTGWYDSEQQRYRLVHTLPTYSQLKSKFMV